MIVARISARALASAIFALAMHAQQSTPTPQDEQALTLRVRSDLVFLPTRIQTKKGDTIYGLTPDQFIVEDDGVRQPVSIEDSPDSESLSLVVVVQCGRSAVEEFNKLQGLGTMIEEMAGGAPHELAVVVYGERPYLLSDFSRSAASARTALSRLKSCGDYHAATIDAVEYSVNLLRHRQNGYRHAILLIGEERDHGSKAKLHEVVADLGVTNTVIYTVAFSPTKSEFLSGLRYGPDGPPKPDPKPSATPAMSRRPDAAQEREQPPEQTKDPEYTDHRPLLALPPLLQLAVNALRENTAKEIASLSGGEYMGFTTQAGFERALQRITNQIHNYYLLSFQPASTVNVGFHAIRVRVAGYPDAKIQTRKGYWSGIPR